MVNESGIDLSATKRIKAYFSSGKPALILKLFLPRANTGTEMFNSRFNSFYESCLLEYIKACERSFKSYDKAPRPATLTVECRQNPTPVCEISIVRSFKLRLPTGETLRGEAVDSFDVESGLFIKKKAKQKANKSLHIKKKPKGQYNVPPVK